MLRPLATLGNVAVNPVRGGMFIVSKPISVRIVTNEPAAETFALFVREKSPQAAPSPRGRDL